jgi:hypothetical protein
MISCGIHGRGVNSVTWQHIITFPVSKLVSSSLLPSPWLVMAQGSCAVKLFNKNNAQYITPYVFLFCILAVPYYWAEHVSRFFFPT